MRYTSSVRMSVVWISSCIIRVFEQLFKHWIESVVHFLSGVTSLTVLNFNSPKPQYFHISASQSSLYSDVLFKNVYSSWQKPA